MRYVDDVFSVIRDETCSQNILNYVNSQHNNRKFTIENEKQNKIPFLDTKVTRKETNFTTSIYHKPTFTGVYLNWTNLTSRKYKISLIYCLCDRIYGCYNYVIFVQFSKYLLLKIFLIFLLFKKNGILN